MFWVSRDTITTHQLDLRGTYIASLLTADLNYLVIEIAFCCIIPIYLITGTVCTLAWLVQ